MPGGSQDRRRRKKKRCWKKGESPSKGKSRMQWYIAVHHTVFLNRSDHVNITSGSINLAGDYYYLWQAGIVMLPVKLGPLDCHLAIWNKSPDSWHRANCEDPDFWIVPNSHLLRKDQTAKWKSTSQRPSMILSFLQPKHCQRGKEEMCIDSVLKGGKILKPLHSSMSLGSWKCSDIKKKKIKFSMATELSCQKHNLSLHRQASQKYTKWGRRAKISRSKWLIWLFANFYWWWGEGRMGKKNTNLSSHEVRDVCSCLSSSHIEWCKNLPPLSSGSNPQPSSFMLCHQLPCFPLTVRISHSPVNFKTRSKDLLPQNKSHLTKSDPS